MIFIENFLRNLYIRISRNVFVDDKSLSLFRIIFGISLALNFESIAWIGTVPKTLFIPHVLSITKLFETFPSKEVFLILESIKVLSIVGIILGIRSRICLRICFLISLVLSSFLYSFGKIDHNIFSLLIIILLSFTNAGSFNAILPDKPFFISKKALTLLSIFIVFAFFTAGYEKFLTWIDFDLRTSGVFSWYYPMYFTLDRTKYLADYFFYTPALIAETMDYAAAIFEVSGIIFLIYSRKSWLLFLSFCIVFHIINLLIFNINFFGYLVVYLIWFIPHTTRLKFLHSRLKS